MSKKTKEKDHVFTEIEVDMDDATRNYLIALGAERFNQLSDEVVEQIMLDYGATIALSESLKVIKKGSEVRVAPIALHDEKCYSKSKYSKNDCNNVDQDDEDDAKTKKVESLPSIEMDELFESVISAFLEVTREDIESMNNRPEYSWAALDKLTAIDVREDRIRKYIKMSRAQRRKFLNRWIEELVEQWR
jgi:uncharacterized membrane protein